MTSPHHPITLKLRPAKPEDAPILHQWDKEPHVLASDPNDDWNWDSELKREPFWREQLMAELDGRPIGFVQIIDPATEESHYWGTDVPPGKRAIDIWIGPADCLGRGYGTAIMTEAINKCFVQPDVEEIWIDPLTENTRAIKFYRRLGFQFVEERFFGEDRCSVHSLTKSNCPPDGVRPII